MSFWVYLKDSDGDSVSVDHHSEGGTYVLGGIPEAELNVTYNYSRPFAKVNFNIRDLDGKQAGETIEKLQEVVDTLGTDASADYWEPTDGNAGFAANILLGWAREAPCAVWRVS